MARIHIKDRTGAVIAKYPRNMPEARMTNAQATQLETDINSSGYYPADGNKYALSYTYPTLTGYPAKESPAPSRWRRTTWSSGSLATRGTDR